MKRILMIAYHFPPISGSSGMQRTLRFAQYLPQFGWQPLVLTVHPMAYENSCSHLMDEVAPDMVVRRAFALDAARHLSIAGRYFNQTALPDRWVSWKFDGIREGLKLIRDYQPQAIWSTYPIATAHVIGAELARRSGLAWIADFRDPMAQDGYPTDPQTWQAFKSIEEKVFRQAKLCTFTAESALQRYRSRYPGTTARLEVVENGYDEEAFASVIGRRDIQQPLNKGKLTLLHSGIVYPEERDPSVFFAALAQIPASQPLIVRFRAPVHEALLKGLISRYRLEARVEILPALPYKDALAEMLRADGLLVLQASNCNEQIPAKVYEYIRACKPILAFTDPSGDTARLLVKSGISTIAPLNAPDLIFDLLRQFVADPKQGAIPSLVAVASASRQARTVCLAAMLDELIKQ